MSLGGDLICRGYTSEGVLWEIGISDAKKPAKNIAHITAPVKTHLAVASSGILKRRGIHAGKAWHHIIDPESNQSADTELALATVCHSSALIADTLATCLVIAGAKKAIKLLNSNKVENALLQPLSGEAIVLGQNIKLEISTSGIV